MEDNTIRLVRCLSPIILLLILVSSLSGCIEPIEGWGDAPDFTLKTLKGETIQLSDYLGTVVLLDFMGVDCYWCFYQMPVLKSISENYTGLVIISIDVYHYETEAYLQSYIDWFKTNYSIDLDWDFGLDKDATIDKLYIKEGEGVPKLVIIDKKGNIYYEKLGYQEYSEIATILDELLE